MNSPTLVREFDWPAADLAVEQLALALNGQQGDRHCLGTWSLRDVACHVAHGLRVHREILGGTASPISLEDSDGFAERGIAEFAGQSFTDLAQAVAEEYQRLRASAEALDGDSPLRWHSGTVVPARAVTGLALAEVVVHGHDVLRAVRRPVPISASLAADIVAGCVHIVPALAKPTSARIAIEMRIRGSHRMFFAVHPTAVTVSSEPIRTDAVVDFAPRTALLSMYRRCSVARAVATGQLRVYGRRPWRALAFQRLMPTP